MIKIDKRIKPPAQRGPGRPPASPWRELKPGHSLFLANKPEAGITAYWRKATGWEFVSRRSIEGGVVGTRVWRLR